MGTDRLIKLCKTIYIVFKQFKNNSFNKILQICLYIWDSEFKSEWYIETKPSEKRDFIENFYKKHEKKFHVIIVLGFIVFCVSLLFVFYGYIIKPVFKFFIK